jgi:hypothetical protein
MVTAEQALHGFWDVMVRSFGRRAPARFDYRSLFPAATAWGWAFRADPARAPEFLEARGVSRDGLTLIGSGDTTVVTPPLFEPGEGVNVEGALPARAVAGADGRLAVAADLGPAATTPQFSGDERRFVARRIRFSRAPGPVATPAAVFPALRPCARGGALTIRLRHPGPRERRRSVAVSVNGRRVVVRRGRARSAPKTVVLRGMPRAGELRVGVRVRTTRNRTLKAARAYPPCA